MVMHRDRQDTLRAPLTDDIIVKHVADFLRRRYATVLFRHQRGLGFLTDDVVAKFDALVADEDRRSRDQLAHLMLRFTAERAIEGALRIAAAQFRHSINPCRGRKSRSIGPGMVTRPMCIGQWQ
jgi:hypothetical protein